MSEEQYHQGKEARVILRYGAFIAPICLILYGLLMQIGSFGGSMLSLTAPSSQLVVIVSLAWLLMGTMTFLTPQSRSWWLSGLELSGYFFLAAIQSIFISNISSPLTAFWVLLLVATFVILGRKGMRAGIFLFIITVALDAFFDGDLTPEKTILALITTVAVLASSLLISTVYATQQTSHQALMASQARENVEKDRVITLINNLTDAVFSTNEHGIVKMYNSAALNLLDTNDRIEGRHISELLELQTVDKEPVDIFRELARSTMIRKREDIIMPLEGEDRLRLEATLAPVQGGDNLTPDGYVLILRDITKVKSLEEERDEFISVVSHELRTPITIAEGSLSNAQLLSERGAVEKVDEAIKEAHNQVLFLAKMVNDLSTLSRAERGIADQAEDIDVTELAAQLMGEYAPQAAEKGLAFDLDVGAGAGTVHVSRLYLHELLQNIITNSIKYTQEGSITLIIKRDAGKLYFGVKDTGIGIGKSDQKKLFERFYRAEDYRTRETSGTGLGLYVSAKLARKLGCKIQVESRLNHGSTFSFYLTQE